MGAPWLILPTYDEAENIEAIVRTADKVLTAASPDGTGQIADRLAKELPTVEVLHRAERQGLGPAYLAGFARALGAGATHVMEMGAAFSHDPAGLARLLEAARNGADVALGSRYIPGGLVSDWGLGRRLVSRG